jgi:hypothetical protein
MVRQTARTSIAAVFAAVFLSGAAFAGVPAANRIFELGEKLPPGMSIDVMRKLLGSPAEERSLRDGAVTRYMWLHGEMGVEVYAVRDAAYKINIMLPCGNDRDVLRVLDGLTRQGRMKYGGTPSYDRVTGQHYWVAKGIRFAFSRYNSTTVLTSRMKVE